MIYLIYIYDVIAIIATDITRRWWLSKIYWTDNEKFLVKSHQQCGQDGTTSSGVGRRRNQEADLRHKNKKTLHLEISLSNCDLKEGSRETDICVASFSSP